MRSSLVWQKALFYDSAVPEDLAVQHSMRREHYSGYQKSEDSPMPDARCPMPSSF
ncbi:hypothetical protein [Microcoleus sp. B4-D4]|uniref:hypothetical protein n=1 Tax=Microcoleus sp. B4-D4 TaxID=2818667 RepID=UPI002FCF8EC4